MENSPAQHSVLPTVALASLGGTITMTADNGSDGVVPRLTADDLVASVPGLAEVACLRVATLRRRPGGSLQLADVLEAVRWARHEVETGAAGAVLVQGTDTLEETSYLADLVWDAAAPLVFTGAMRPPASASADGPANIFAAVSTAASEAARGTGVTVVLDDTLHAARSVRKAHATALSAFASPNGGPIGQVHEGRVRLWASLQRFSPLPLPSAENGPRVALVETSLGDDGSLVAAVADGAWDGLVIAGFGAGHVPAMVAEHVSRAVERMPVVVASRTGGGGTLRSTYGFPGSESDLIRRGAVLAGTLDERKARILLWSLLASGADRPEIARAFAERGNA